MTRSYQIGKISCKGVPPRSSRLRSRGNGISRRHFRRPTNELNEICRMSDIALPRVGHRQSGEGGRERASGERKELGLELGCKEGRKEGGSAGSMRSETFAPRAARGASATGDPP